MRRLLLLLVLPWLAAAAPCEPCSVPGGTYHVALPPHWDGHAALPLLLFLHGYRGKGTDITTDPNIAGVTGEQGVLLAAPDGEAGSWGHVGSPHRGRDDLAFLHTVLADIGRRWPIDRHAVIAGGFSQGASMVWDLACYDAAEFTAFIPFSGGFWQPMPPACTSGPVILRHTHGLHDSMVPMAGRAILGGAFRQADILQGFTRWQAEDRCPAAPDRTATEGALTCRFWSDCGSSGRLALCTHDGDHSMIRPWLAASLRWALAGGQ